ncbi:unnamed protein product [Camellia sinensis]
MQQNDCPEVHANTAETLCAITRYAPPGLAAKITSPSFIGRLFCHALEDSRPKSVLVNSLSVCISLLDPKRLTLGTYHFYSRQLSHGSTISANPETVEGMLGSLGDLLKLLDVSSDDNALITTYGKLQPPLGKHRLKSLDISPRDLALLCQKVENHVVGAPCGVMDQMTSACGEANKLLAMICQPAEVIGLVAIPSHIRFWGIDSGIRHSIGGADYGSVRVGAFIGRKMIKSIASAMLSQSLSSANENIDELNEDGVELLQAEVLLDYLCNLLPHSCSTNSPRLKMGGTIVKNVGSNLKHCWQIIDMKNGCRDYFSGRIAAGCAREYIYFCYGSIAAVDCVHGPHNLIIRPLNSIA